MANKESLFYIGYKSKANIKTNYPSYIICKQINDNQHSELIKWFFEELRPLIDKKLDEIKGNTTNGD